MSTNKHAQIRYNTLDKCFRNSGKNYTIDMLLEACNSDIFEFDPSAEGIKKRQLYDDIRFMQSEQGWSIELNEELKIGKKRIYRYLDPAFSISQQPLNESDANLLKAALITLSRFKGLPQFDWVEELTLRLEDNFKLSSRNRDIISFEENEYLKGIEYITQLYNAIHYKKVLEIKYQSFKSSQAIVFNLHPYYLKQYNNRWFLLGQDANYKNLTHLALDRISAIKECDLKFKDTDIDFNEYFEDVVGVTVPDIETCKLVLKISNDAIKYITTKPIHGSQKIIEKQNEFTTVQLELKPNYELESILLSFGENVEVIEPETLRSKIRERIKSLLNFYED